MFGYKLPTFNIWARVWYFKASGPEEGEGGHYGPYWTRAQLRGNGRNDNYEGLLLPKWTRVRGDEWQESHIPDIIQCAGWGPLWAFPLVVRDVGAGFPNEHRTVSFHFPFRTSWNDAPYRVMPGVSTLLEPPVGYLPCPLDPPFVTWEDPDLMSSPTVWPEWPL